MLRPPQMWESIFLMFQTKPFNFHKAKITVLKIEFAFSKIAQGIADVHLVN